MDRVQNDPASNGHSSTYPGQIEGFWYISCAIYWDFGMTIAFLVNY